MHKSLLKKLQKTTTKTIIGFLEKKTSLSLDLYSFVKLDKRKIRLEVLWSELKMIVVWEFERLIEERYAEVKRKQDHLRMNVAQDQTI